MNLILRSAAVLGLCLTTAHAQVQVHTSEPVLIVPQARHVIWHPPRHPPRPHPVPSVTLTSVAADVTVTDQVASTTMVLSLSNPGPRPQEAQILIPVPDGATVRSFQLDSLGPEPTARVVPRDEARRIYNEIVARMIDPGLLEFAGYGLIKSSVFPVPANGTNTVRLTYEVLLTADGDRVDYLLPRTDSLVSSGVRWTLSMDIRSRRPISTVYSPSHDLVTERHSPNHVTVKATAESASNPGSFRVSYLHQSLDQAGVSATLLAYPDAEVGPDGGYFLLLTGLPARKPDDVKPVNREVTIVIDRSGSMRGQKIDQAREAALQVVEGLDPGEYFNIIDYSDSIASFADKPVVKSDETMKRAREYLAMLRANGGTNINDALLEALRPDPTPGTLPVVLFLTDGLPTVGQTGEIAIRDAAKAANKANRRVFTFGVGHDVNAPLLSGIARTSRAATTFVLPDENVEVKVGQVFRRLSGPVLDSPRLVTPGTGTRPIRELQPAVLPDLFDGDQLVILGQYTDSTARNLVLEGNFLGEARRFEFSFDTAKATNRNSFVPRLWASRKIAMLIDEIRQAGASDVMPGSMPPPEHPRTKELVDEIVRLSVKWGILTEYTSFLATEMTVSTGERNEAGAFVEGLVVTGGGPMDPASAPRRANDSLRERAVQLRAGKAAVNQDLNLGYQAMQTCENKLNVWRDEDLNYVQVTSVCQVADRTLFKRADRWVDSRILDKEAEAPDKTIAFASEEYFKLVDDLVKENRQGLLAQGGDCYLLHNGQRVLVKAPNPEG